MPQATWKHRSFLDVRSNNETNCTAATAVADDNDYCPIDNHVDDRDSTKLLLPLLLSLLLLLLPPSLPQLMMMMMLMTLLVIGLDECIRKSEYYQGSPMPQATTNRLQAPRAVLPVHPLPRLRPSWWENLPTSRYVTKLCFLLGLPDVLVIAIRIMIMMMNRVTRTQICANHVQCIGQNHAQHECHVVRTVSSAIKSESVEIAYILDLGHNLNSLTDQGREITGLPGENHSRRASENATY